MATQATSCPSPDQTGEISPARRAHDNAEIRREIASYLPKGELPRCARISKMWHETASELIWRRPTVENDTNSFNSASRSIKHVRSLDYYRDISPTLIIGRFIGKYHPQVRHLYVSPKHGLGIDFERRVISLRRSTYCLRSLRPFEDPGCLPGFKVLEYLELLVSFHHYPAESISENEEDESPANRSYDLATIVAENIQDAGRSVDINSHEIRIDRMEVDLGHIDANKVEPVWWKHVPHLRHLSSVHVVTYGESFVTPELSHLLRNPHLRECHLSARNASLTTFLNLFPVLNEWQGTTNLVIRLHLHVDREQWAALQAECLELCPGTPHPQISVEPQSNLGRAPSGRLKVACRYRWPGSRFEWDGDVGRIWEPQAMMDEIAVAVNSRWDRLEVSFTKADSRLDFEE